MNGMLVYVKQQNSPYDFQILEIFLTHPQKGGSFDLRKITELSQDFEI